MRIPTALTVMVAAAAFSVVHADTPPPVSAPTGQKTLAATLNVYAFPGAGQSASQQSKDETECYNWAVSNTGSDPFQAAKQADQAKQQAAQQEQQTQQATEGAGAEGAVRGAAAGAVVGAVAGDTGQGAAIGATAGLIAGRSRARGAKQQAAASGASQTQAATQASAQQIDGFKKAFSSCLEAKKYTVKF